MSAETRIAPLPVPQFTEEQAELGGGRESSRIQLNFVRTLVRHPKLYGSWIPFAEQLIFGSHLPAREREILIIRTSELCGERYEAAHHIHIGRTLGLTDAEIESAKSDGRELSPFEQVLIRAVNDLVGGHCISDATWDVLAQHYSTEQLMEVVFLVANYSLIAMVTNSFAIKPEADVENSWKPF